MTRAIVTTTVYPPGACIEAHAARQGWDLIVVGDQKTPHGDYEGIDCLYLSPAEQESLYPELSRRIGWNRIERRTMGLAYAYQHGYDVVAVVDDDNIPYPQWGENLLVGEEVSVDIYETDLPAFEPLREVGYPELWHRGFPWEWLKRRETQRYAGKARRRILVQADLWDGDPDIDALCRMTHHPTVRIGSFEPMASPALMPFNSQNTFLHRSVLPEYMMLTEVGRHHDIWASYLLQHFHPHCAVYTSASVYQRRHPHDPVDDLLQENDQYRFTAQLLSDLPAMENILKPKTLDDFQYYRELMRSFE